MRKGSKFLDVGVLICPQDTGDLASRRALRRQRRTLRSRKRRRQWFAAELAKLGLPKPTTPVHDPVGLRLQAIQGVALAPEQLHASLTHLFRRSGYAEVPWKAREAVKAEKDAKKEMGEIKERLNHLTEEMHREACQFPCEFLIKRGQQGLRQRKEVWPRDLLKKEFRAIAAAQATHFPALLQKADWLLYGDTKIVQNHHVFFNNTEGQNADQAKSPHREGHDAGTRSISTS